MRTFSPVLSFAALVAALAAQDPAAARVDRDAMLQHYARVEVELRAAPAPADAAIAVRRAEAIDLLSEYRLRGFFGIGPLVNGTRTPLFVDDDGRRCAVAWILERTGRGELVQAIANRCNEAWVAELTTDAVLQSWLGEYGLTAAEAVRIQGPHGGPPGGGTPPPEPEPEADGPSEATPRGDQTSGSGSGGNTSSGGSSAGSQPRSPDNYAARGSMRAGGRGMALDAMESAAWLDWWQWNRGAFELPAVAVKSAPATTTSAARDLRRDEALALLQRLATSTDAGVRAAAVQALGRVGASADALKPHLADAARGVRLSALLGLGSGGSPAHAHALAAQVSGDQQGETIAVALAGIAVLEAGPAQRMLTDAVAALLADSRPSVQAAAAMAATQLDGSVVRPAARKLLADSNPPMQRAAAAQLLADGATDEDVAALTALVNDRSIEVRRAAALALGRSRHLLALPALQTAFELEHENATRALQLLAVGDHRGDAGKTFLLQELARGSKALRGHAALALGLWGRGRDGITDVADAITAALADESNRDQRGAYLLALGMLQHAPARTLLLAEVEKGANSSSRGAAAAALGLLGDRAALPVLTKALANDSCPWARQQVARAMAALGSDAIDTLAATMRTDKDATVQSDAAWALGSIADPRAAAALHAFAADETVAPAARAGAVHGLGRHFRQHEPQLPALRFQHHNKLLPSIAAWAFAQEL
jgi:HEAT repeat protein